MGGRESYIQTAMRAPLQGNATDPGKKRYYADPYYADPSLKKYYESCKITKYDAIVVVAYQNHALYPICIHPSRGFSIMRIHISIHI